MTNRMFQGFLFLLLVTLATLHAEPIIKDGQKIAFMGDSITQFGWKSYGTGAMNPNGYLHLVEIGLNALGIKVEIIPAGISGNKSDQMLARLKGVLNQKPDVMTLSCGVNDVWHGERGIDLETYKKNITAIIDQTLANGTKIVILTATPIQEDLDNDLNKKLAAYNDFLRQIAKEKNLPLADLNADFQAAIKANPPAKGTYLLTCDGVHMNTAGNLVMALGVLKALGIPDSDFAKINEAIDKAPGSGFLDLGWRNATWAGISMGDYHALEKIAATKDINAQALAAKLYLEANMEVLKENEQTPLPNLDAVSNKIRITFEKKLKDLNK